MKKLFLTLIVAFATVCGFAQEKVWEDVGQATERAQSLMSIALCRLFGRGFPSIATQGHCTNLKGVLIFGIFRLHLQL